MHPAFCCLGMIAVHGGYAVFYINCALHDIIGALQGVFPVVRNPVWRNSQIVSGGNKGDSRCKLQSKE